MFCRSLFVFSGVRVTRSLVLYVCFVDRCLSLVGFVLLDLQFYMYVLQIVVCLQWCTCYQIFSFICMFCRSLFVFSGVRVTRSLVLYVCFVDRCLSLVVYVLLDLQFYMYVLQIVVCLQWCTCYQIFSFICMFCRSLFVFSGVRVTPLKTNNDLQNIHIKLKIFSFICMFCRSLFVFSGVRVTRSLVLYVCFVDRCLSLVVYVLLDLQFYMYVLQIVVCLQWGSCYQIFSFICMFCRSLFVFSGVRVTRSLVLYVCFVDRCLSLVGFVLLDLQFYMYVLQIVVCLQWCTCYQIFSFICMFCRSLFVFSGVRVTRSLVLYVCFVDRCLSLVVYVLLDLQFYMYVLQIVVCLQWGSCYSIFSFICMFCRSLFVFSGVRVTRSLVLYVCFVDSCLSLVVYVLLDLQFYMYVLQIVVFLQWGSCYSIFSFICMFCRSLFVFSGVRVTRSLVLYVCFVDRCLSLVGFVLLDLQFYMYVLQIVVCLQWCTCYQIFSFICMFCRSMFVFSGVRVTRSLVLYVCFVDSCLSLVVYVLLDLQFYMYVLQIVVCLQWGSCYSIFSFICMFCRSLFVFSGVRVTRSLVLYVCFVDRCLSLVGFVLLDLQFYMYVLQIVVCLQWCTCYQIFSFICMFCRSLFVFSGVRVTRSLVLYVCFVDSCLSLVVYVLLDLQFYMYVLQIVVCLQWGSCYSIFSFICMFCRSLFVFSGVRVTRSLVLYVCFVDRCLSLVGFVLLDLQFYMYVLQIVVCLQWCTCYQIFSFICMFCRSLFVFSGVRVTRSLVLYVCFVDRCLSLVVYVLLDLQFYMYVLQIVVCLQWCTCYQIFSFICMFCRSLFVFLCFFFFLIVLSFLLRYTDSDYPFGIFKPFLR